MKYQIGTLIVAKNGFKVDNPNKVKVAFCTIVEYYAYTYPQYGLNVCRHYYNGKIENDYATFYEYDLDKWRKDESFGYTFSEQ
jgi:hypothetical protein